MRRSDLRLLPGACAVWGLAVLGIALGAPAALAAGAVLTAGVLSVAVVVNRRALTHLLLAHLGVLALAGVLLFPALLRHDAAVLALDEAAREGLVVEMMLSVRADPEPPAGGPEWSRDGLQVMARTVPAPARIGDRRVLVPASVTVLVRGADGPGDGSLSGLRGGQDAVIRGKVRSSGSLLVLIATEVRAVQATGPAGRAQHIRYRLRDLARDHTAHLPADESALVRGMTTGDTAGLAASSEEIMRRAGISHLVAVSGANIALVLAAVIAPLLLAGVRRRPRLLIAAAVGTGYVALVGEEPSVQRAATMAAPLLIARFAGVRASPVAALALTVALWSVVDPVTAASVGFALSALATAAILIAAPPLARAITESTRDRIGPAAALVLAVPLVAQLACTPILVTLAPEVSLWAVPVNMVVGPIVAPTTVIGLAALLVGPFLPGVAQLLNTVAGGGAHLVLLIASAADALPGSRITVAEGATGALASLALCALFAVAVATRRSSWTRWAVAAALVASLTPSLAARWPGQQEPDWMLTACAVGQGDAVLLRSGATTVLIDTGPEPEMLRACLDRMDVHTVDLLILSHPHADHTGGRDALTGTRIPTQQWVCPLPEAQQQTAAGAMATPAQTGHTWQQDGLALEVLWPPTAEHAQRAAAREDGSGEGDAANDCSIVIAATWPDGTRLISLGDLEPVGQRELAALEPGPATIVKVAHHGSARQEPRLYEELSPELALITVGESNSFGHPTLRVLDILAATGAPVVRTDRHGTVVLPEGEPLSPRSVGPPR